MLADVGRLTYLPQKHFSSLVWRFHCRQCLLNVARRFFWEDTKLKLNLKLASVAVAAVALGSNFVFILFDRARALDANAS